jgi:hypothetical protein
MYKHRYCFRVRFCHFVYSSITRWYVELFQWQICRWKQKVDQNFEVKSGQQFSTMLFGNPAPLKTSFSTKTSAKLGVLILSVTVKYLTTLLNQ